jgi:hypothetical protein
MACLTLSHEVFEVVPFYIVGQVADVDAAILLRCFFEITHHLFPSS